MAKKSLTQEEQVNVRQDIKSKINELMAKLDEDGIREARDSFIEKFIICETIYKIVLKRYLQVNNMFIDDGKMKIQLAQVKSALKSAGYSPDEGLLDRIFSGSGKYIKAGSKSARKLRNGIEHEMNVGDLQEVKDRYDELVKDMESFIAWIQI